MGQFRLIKPNTEEGKRWYFFHVEEACQAIGLDFRSYRHGSRILQAIGGRKSNAGRILANRENPNEGAVCNWITMEYAIYSNRPWKSLYTMTPAERKQFEQEERRREIARFEALREFQAEKEREDAQRWAITQSVISAIYKLPHRLKPVVDPNDHPYLLAKHMPIPNCDGVVDPIELSIIDKRTLNRVFDECGLKNAEGKPFRFGRSLGDSLLMAPLYGFLPHSDKLSPHSLQFIDDRGQKGFLKGGMVKGCFWVDRTVSLWKAPRIAVGEGIATSYTYSQYFGVPAVSAMNCGNLEAVAKAIADHYHPDKIIILSDVGNGEEKALQACRAVNGELVKPKFTVDLIKRFKALKGPDKVPTDWNDWLIVKELI